MTKSHNTVSMIKSSGVRETYAEGDNRTYYSRSKDNRSRISKVNKVSRTKPTHKTW